MPATGGEGGGRGGGKREREMPATHAGLRAGRFHRARAGGPSALGSCPSRIHASPEPPWRARKPAEGGREREGFLARRLPGAPLARKEACGRRRTSPAPPGRVGPMEAGPPPGPESPGRASRLPRGVLEHGNPSLLRPTAQWGIKRIPRYCAIVHFSAIVHIARPPRGGGQQVQRSYTTFIVLRYKIKGSRRLAGERAAKRRGCARDSETSSEEVGLRKRLGNE